MESIIPIDVYGGQVLIDYEKENVTFPQGWSKEKVQLVSFYLNAEGFLDEQESERHKSLRLNKQIPIS